MFYNYFLTAYRSLVRNRKHTLLNMAGLGVAMAACLVLFLVIRFELSFNKHFSKYNSICQIVSKSTNADGEHFTGGVPFPFLKHLRQDYPTITFGQLMQNYGSQVIARKGDESLEGSPKFIEDGGMFFAEPQIALLFDFHFLAGNEAVLKKPNAVVISKKIAEKYFGTWQAAIGNTLEFDNNHQRLVVEGVIEDMPDNTDFPFRIVASYAGFENKNRMDPNGWPIDSWDSNTSSHQVFADISANGDKLLTNSLLANIEKKFVGNRGSENRAYLLHPMADIHFDERFGTGGDHQTSRNSLFILGSVGILILLMACINFINLTTALSIGRSKEIGVRKVLGSNRSQIRLQIITEMSVIVLLSVFAGVGLASILLPYVKHVLVVQTTLDLFHVDTVLFLIAISVFAISISSLYPAIIMGGFRPIEALKSRINTRQVGNISIRRILVVLQFAFSQVFIIATFITIRQMDYIRNTNLGFNQEGILTLQGNSDSTSLHRRNAFKQDLLALKGVQVVSFSFDAPSSFNSWQSNFAYDSQEDKDFEINLKMADEHYLETYELQLAAGRFFGKSDTTKEYVVNETFAKRMGAKTPQEVIGKPLRIGGNSPKPICGVVKDFHLNSLKSKIPVIAIFPNKRHMGLTGIKLSGGNMLKTRGEIEKVWNLHFPEYVFNATFLDENIQKFYVHEERLGTLYKVYAALAIFISCLGLYGLISFLTVQKTKEVGIRKLLGASIQSIVFLFSKEFTILIGIAFLFAAPLAWYVMNEWLKDFAYKISPGPGIFMLAMLSSGVIAWLTVGIKAFQAAKANPIKSLRTE